MNDAPAIRQAVSPADIALTHELFTEYAASLNVDLCFQGFAEELATLPGAYVPPWGRLFLAGCDDLTFGCVALRPLSADGECQVASNAAPVAIGEIKRLYVRPAQRGDGWGARLVSTVMTAAGSMGYSELRLDSLDFMVSARRLYAAHGFRECAPYYDNPLPGVVYMSCIL
jgi:GNAT superfamily N-acetyltransferase